MTDGTPLHAAASRGLKDIAELVIAKGADVNARAKNGATPVMLAAKAGRRETVALQKKTGQSNAAQEELKLLFISGSGEL